MRSAWVCACDAAAGAAVVAHLTELGYTPRRAASTAPASAVADLSDGAEPEVAIVTAAAGTARAALAVVAALRAAPALDGLAIVLVLDPAALEDAPTAPEADEVMIAPGTAAELRWRIARTRAEPGVAGDGDIVALDGLVLNLATYETTVDGRLVELTHMEHRLLRFLATHRGRVFTREALLERVWGHAVYGATRTVDVHVRRIRAKLGPEHGQRIQTVRSVGYRLEA